MRNAPHVSYQLATDDDDIPPDRVVHLRDPDGDSIVLLVRPGHATEELLREQEQQLRSMLETGLWYRPEPTPEAANHPRRVRAAGWIARPPDELPDGALCMSMEEVGRHMWIVRDTEVSAQCVAEMNELLMAMVTNVIWIQRGASDKTRPDAARIPTPRTAAPSAAPGH
ncbi:hypothetical protein [Streptomyces sp. NPDC096153]|uniref:hypothetical protein n=1 Tax=Streptomyces sp. NPDC096153 TaxID=3155548 RepID=UPI003329BE1E